MFSRLPSKTDAKFYTPPPICIRMPNLSHQELEGGGEEKTEYKTIKYVSSLYPLVILLHSYLVKSEELNSSLGLPFIGYLTLVLAP